MVDVLKLMCLFEIFGLPDCAAELVLVYGELVGNGATRSGFLDVLASEQTGAMRSFVDLHRRFVEDAIPRSSTR